ncbi:hypothetical protein PG999_008512 [Apiospora kogelbergensis]|uniref:F-box domain-containing protein n=1 Tax=Apiospora kogelbergensis TaxID=1337665 RepID=A0AAW0QIU7_9PEZI
MSDNSTPFLFRLPVEVLYLVLAQFCEHCRWKASTCVPGTRFHRKSHWMLEDRYWADKQDLRSLSLVSTALRGPAQAVLHHLCMNGFYNLRYTPFFRFVGSVTTNTPHLIRNVKALALGHGHVQRMPKIWRRNLDEPEASYLRAFLLSEPGGITKINFIAKLLATFPSLTHFSLGECVDDSTDYVPASLEQLEELALTCIHVCANPRMRQDGSATPTGLGKLIAKVLALSRGLRVLIVDSCFETTAVFGRLDSPPQLQLCLAQLRVLHLKSAWLDAKELEQVIATCPALCELKYFENYDGPSGGRAKKAPLGPLGAVQALAPCRQHLRSLELELCQQAPTGNSIRPAVSFACFTALRDLTVQWRTVCCPSSNEEEEERGDEWQQLLVRALPDSIRSLSIIGCACETLPKRFAAALSGLAASKASGGRFLHLTYVGCDVDAMMDIMRCDGSGDEDAYVPPEYPVVRRGAPRGFQSYDEARDKYESYRLFDREDSIRTALAAAGVQRVEYSMAWRTGFRSRSYRRAQRREEEIAGCMYRGYEYQKYGPQFFFPESDDSDWDDDL